MYSRNIRVKNQGTNKFKFNNTKAYYPYVLVICIVLLFSLAGFTLAFFYESDWGNTTVTLSGKVDIVAVGSDGSSIEDTATSSGLIMYLHDGYNVLIPGGEVTAIANCKVMPSTTQPLLRAKFNIYLVDKNGTAMNISDDISNLSGNLFYEINDIVTNNNWYKYTDGYYYYIGDNPLQSPRRNTILKAVGSLTDEVVVNFMDKSFKFPTFVTSYYSGWGVKLEVRFEAIQDFIPDVAGNKMANTIQNSLKVFRNDAPGALREPNVEVTFDASNNLVITPDESGAIPKKVVLPDKDTNGNSITTLTKSMANSLKNAGVEEIVLPSSYTSIAEESFEGYSNIKSVDLSQTNIIELQDYTFSNCTNLKTVLLPDTVEILAEGCLEGCGLTEINLPDSLQTIGAGALNLNHLTTLFIPAGVNSMYHSCIIGEYLKSIIVDEDNPIYTDVNNQTLVQNGTTIMYVAPKSLVDENGNYLDYYIPEGVTGFAGTNSLYFCKINIVYFPKSNLSSRAGVLNTASYISGYGVYGENNTTYTITDNGQAIYYQDVLLSCNRFNYNEEEFVIKDGTRLLDFASLWYTNCKRIKIPSSVTELYRTIIYTNNIEEIYFYSSTPPTYTANGTSAMYKFLYGCNPNVKIYVPASSVSLYKSQSWMGEFADNVVAMP